MGLVLRNQLDCSECTQQAVKHCRVNADLAGDRRGNPMLVGAKMGENVELCPGVKNLAAPPPEDEIDNMIHGSRHGLSPFCVDRYRAGSLARPEEFVAVEP